MFTVWVVYCGCEYYILLGIYYTLPFLFSFIYFSHSLFLWILYILFRLSLHNRLRSLQLNTNNITDRRNFPLRTIRIFNFLVHEVLTRRIRFIFHVLFFFFAIPMESCLSNPSNLVDIVNHRIFGLYQFFTILSPYPRLDYKLVDKSSYIHGWQRTPETVVRFTFNKVWRDVHKPTKWMSLTFLRIIIE